MVYKGPGLRVPLKCPSGDCWPMILSGTPAIHRNAKKVLRFDDAGPFSKALRRIPTVEYHVGPSGPVPTHQGARIKLKTGKGNRTCGSSK